MQTTQRSSKKKRGPGRPRSTDMTRASSQRRKKASGRGRPRKRGMNASAMASSMLPLSGRSRNRKSMSSSSSPSWRDATLFLGSVALVGFLLESARRVSDRMKQSQGYSSPSMSEGWTSGIFDRAGKGSSKDFGFRNSGRKKMSRRGRPPKKRKSMRASSGIPSTF